MAGHLVGEGAGWQTPPATSGFDLTMMPEGDRKNRSSDGEPVQTQEWVTGQARRRPWIEYVVVGTLVTILTLFFWPFGGQQAADDPQPEQPVEARVVTPVPSPTPTPTPEPEQAMPVILCTPGDVTQPFVDFIRHFNAGDFDRLRQMLPDEAHLRAPAVTVGMRAEQRQFYGFYHQSRTGLSDPDDVVSWLQTRHEAGERWRLLEYRLGRQYMDEVRGTPELDTVTAFIQRRADDFPTHVVEGTATINCVVDLVIHWSFFTGDPDLAEPITVDHFLSTIGPYNPGQMRFMRVIVTTGLRDDGGALLEWEILRDEATSTEGRFVERVRVRTLDGDTIVTLVFDADRWYLNQRGWEAKGDVSRLPVLPLEIMVARQDPTRSAHLIIEQLDEIPEEGAFVIEQDLDDMPQELRMYSHYLGATMVEQSFEVLIEDGAVTHSRFRLLDDDGVHYFTPEIRWVEIRRAEGYDPRLFMLPGGIIDPGFQFDLPTSIPDGLILVSAERESGGQSELFVLDSDGVPLEVRVMPSRGGLDVRSGAGMWDPARPVHVVEASHGPVLWTSQRDDGQPTGAIWDTGRYRFELHLTGDLAPGTVWDEATLIELVEFLSFGSVGTPASVPP
jgi:hypothetical protein